ncbi:unnamed protein product [Cuscuta europaea]|uniref:Uncharacterized protein n=1 Tax=Cuscuta europaea TaxID=41803 RepID=A0A9P0Z0B1_CUSEU|nr:unnamed protein product [Cuscuta europaea]
MRPIHSDCYSATSTNTMNKFYFFSKEWIARIVRMYELTKEEILSYNRLTKESREREKEREKGGGEARRARGRMDCRGDNQLVAIHVGDYSAPMMTCSGDNLAETSGGSQI